MRQNNKLTDHTSAFLSAPLAISYRSISYNMV